MPVPANSLSWWKRRNGRKRSRSRTGCRSRHRCRARRRPVRRDRRHAPRPVRSAARCLAGELPGIAEKILQRHPHQRPIGRRLQRRRGHELHVAPHGGAELLGEVARDGGKIHRLAVQWLVSDAGQIEQCFGHGADLARLVTQQRNTFPTSGIDRVAVLVQQQFGVHLHVAHRGADIVRNRGDERFELRGPLAARGFPARGIPARSPSRPPWCRPVPATASPPPARDAAASANTFRSPRPDQPHGSAPSPRCARMSVRRPKAECGDR